MEVISHLCYNHDSAPSPSLRRPSWIEQLWHGLLVVSRWEARESVDRTFWAEGPSCPFPIWLFLRKTWGDGPIIWWDIPSTCLIVTEYFWSWKCSSVFFEQNHFTRSSSAFNITLNWEAGHRWKLKGENKVGLLYVSVASGHLETRIVQFRMSPDAYVTPQGMQ